MTLIPTPTRILVIPEEAQEKSKGGLYIPETVQEKTQFGTVVDVGHECTCGVKGGDKIIFDKYSGTTIKYNNKSFLLLTDENVIGIIKK